MQKMIVKLVIVPLVPMTMQYTLIIVLSVFDYFYTQKYILMEIYNIKTELTQKMQIKKLV